MHLYAFAWTWMYACTLTLSDMMFPTDRHGVLETTPQTYATKSTLHPKLHDCCYPKSTSQPSTGPFHCGTTRAWSPSRRFETSYNQNQNTSKYRKVQIIWSLCGYFFGSFDVKTLVRQIFVILYPHRDVHVLEWMETYHPTTRDAGKSAVNWHMDMENIRHL